MIHGEMDVGLIVVAAATIAQRCQLRSPLTPFRLETNQTVPRRHRPSTGHPPVKQGERLRHNARLSCGGQLRKRSDNTKRMHNCANQRRNKKKHSTTHDQSAPHKHRNSSAQRTTTAANSSTRGDSTKNHTTSKTDPSIHQTPASPHQDDRPLASHGPTIRVHDRAPQKRRRRAKPPRGNPPGSEQRRRSGAIGEGTVVGPGVVTASVGSCGAPCPGRKASPEPRGCGCCCCFLALEGGERGGLRGGGKRDRLRRGRGAFDLCVVEEDLRQSGHLGRRTRTRRRRTRGDEGEGWMEGARGRMRGEGRGGEGM